VVLTAAWLAKSISRPVAQLTAASQRMAAGELTQDLPARGDDEIADMARSFNRMAAEVRTAHGSLEEQVRQRTAELSREMSERRGRTRGGAASRGESQPGQEPVPRQREP